jgi:hypothetical protein
VFGLRAALQRPIGVSESSPFYSGLLIWIKVAEIGRGRMSVWAAATNWTG